MDMLFNFFLLAMSNIFIMPIGLTDTASLPQRNSNETAPMCDKVCEFDEWSQTVHCEKRALDKIPFPSGCEGAIMLELQGNSITYIATDSLFGYRNVITMDISNNEISALEPETFTTMANLKNLLLSYNQLMDIQNGTFLGTENHLQMLCLNGNQIFNLNKHAFSGLNAIATLYLHNNQLELLPVTIFRGLYNMQYINLAMNHLTQIAAHTFKGLVNLRFLKLDNNKLSWLPNGLFRGLQSLAEVHLSHNALLYIPSPDSLGVLDTFQLFDVSHNNLTEPGNILPYLTIAEIFYFGGNPYICDCDFLLLQKWYDNKYDKDRSSYVTSPVLCHMDSLVFNIDDVVTGITSCDTGSSTSSPRYPSMPDAGSIEKPKELKKSPVLEEKNKPDAVLTSPFLTDSLNSDHKMQTVTRIEDSLLGVTIYCAIILTLFFVLWTAKSAHFIVLQKKCKSLKGTAT